MNKNIAQKIRRLRQTHDLSQDNMADELGITKGAYSKLERGVTAITVDRLAEIAKVLDVTVHVIFRDEKQKGIAFEHLPEYGYATKGDIDELVRIIASFREELANIKKDLPAAPDKKASATKGKK